MMPSDFCRSCRLNRSFPICPPSAIDRRLVPPRGRKTAHAVHLLGLGLPVDPEERAATRGTRLRVPGGFDRRRRQASADRTRQRIDHPQHRRGGRCAPREGAHAAERAVPHSFGAFPSRDRPLLLGPADCLRSACSRLSARFRRRARRLSGRRSSGTIGDGPPARWERQLHQRVCHHASLGGLGGVLGALPAHGRCARNGRRHGPRAPAQAQRRAAHAAAARSPESRLPRLRLHDRVLAVADLRAQQPEPRTGAARQLSLRALRTGHRKLRFIHDTIDRQGGGAADRWNTARAPPH